MLEKKSAGPLNNNLVVCVFDQDDGPIQHPSSHTHHHVSASSSSSTSSGGGGVGGGEGSSALLTLKHEEELLVGEGGHLKKQKSPSYHSSDEIPEEEDEEEEEDIPLRKKKGERENRIIINHDDPAFDDSAFEEEDNSSGGGSSEGKQRNNLKHDIINFMEEEERIPHGEEELAMFDIEVSPKYNEDQLSFQEQREEEHEKRMTLANSQPQEPDNQIPDSLLSRSNSKGRRVHYREDEDNPPPPPPPADDQEQVITTATTIEGLDTILLPPPLILPEEQENQQDETMGENHHHQLICKQDSNSSSIVLPNSATSMIPVKPGSQGQGGEEERLLEEEEDIIYVAPDGGWGWWVLFGSIIVNILIPGTVKSFGILFVEFLEVFDASPAAAAWIPALSYWLYSSMGPFAGALAIKYSHRTVTIVGGLLASTGLMLSYFANSIPYLYVSYGIIGGLGAGLAYPTGVFMVGQYFDRRRGLANGICTGGSALGSVLIPPLLRYLLSEYGYRWAILIMGGLLLNVCIGAMFYEPVEKHMIPKKREKPNELPVSPAEEEEEKLSTTLIIPPRQVTSPIPRLGPVPPGGSPRAEIAASMPIAIPISSSLRAGLTSGKRGGGSGSGRKATFHIGHEDDSWSEYNTEVAMSPLAVRLIKEESFIGGPDSSASPVKWKPPAAPVPITGGDTDQNPTPNVTVTPKSRGQSRLNLQAIPEDVPDDERDPSSSYPDWNYYSALTPAKQRLLRLSVAGGSQLVGSCSSGGLRSGHPSTAAMGGGVISGLPRTASVASNVSTSSFHYMSSPFHHGTLLMAMQQGKPEFASTLTLKSVKDAASGGCCPWRRKRKENKKKKKKQKELIETETDASPPTQKFIDFSLLRDEMYLIMLLSNSTTAVGYTNFIVLLPAYAKELGYDKSVAAFLLSVVAALDFCGRIGGAALSDILMKLISRKWYYIMGLLFSGIALCCFPLIPSTSYSWFLVVCGAFGLASGTYIGVTAVLLADQLGAEKLGSSYGISLFINGLLQLVGPPICGALLQVTGKKHGPILAGLGVTLIMGAAVWLLSPFAERRKRRREQEAALMASMQKRSSTSVV